MLIELLPGNAKEVIAVAELLVDRKITYDIRSGQSCGSLEILCLEGFGKNGNSRESLAERLSKIPCVLNIWEITVPYKLVGRRDQYRNLFSRNKKNKEVPSLKS